MASMVKEPQLGPAPPPLPPAPPLVPPLPAPPAPAPPRAGGLPPLAPPDPGAPAEPPEPVSFPGDSPLHPAREARTKAASVILVVRFIEETSSIGVGPTMGRAESSVRRAPLRIQARDLVRVAERSTDSEFEQLDEDHVQVHFLHQSL